MQMNKSFILLIALAANIVFADGMDKDSTLVTKWATEVKPEAPLPEYPRPQMVRSQWLNLNGQWDYAVTSAGESAFETEGKITVPFALESYLSGVGRKLQPGEALWYERSFKLPGKWKGKRILLNFGAVDWKAEVWVNEKFIGRHTGGYTPFSFDITDALATSGKQKLRVKVMDSTDHSWQPRGKQWLTPYGVWYTAVSGIWQTVWLEPVSEAHLNSYYTVTNLKTGELRIHTNIDGEYDAVSVLLLDGDTPVAQASGKEVLDLIVPSPKCWSPDSPFLYGLKLNVIKNGKVIDTATGYAAMREISIKSDDSPWKYKRLALNGETVFHFGLLDQGWWPDGLYTAPTDEALKYDIEKTKAWGFNMIRKHIKVEPARWYYWCDVLGLMVWQDMPCIGDNFAYKKNVKYPGDLGRGEPLSTQQSNKWSKATFAATGTDCDVPQEWKDNFYKEWGEIIDALKVFPSVCVWIPFNEAWGQFDTGNAVRFTKEKDPTRLVDPASGGNYDVKNLGDIIDTHHYPIPAMNAFDARFVNVQGEYGGIGFPVSGHLWNAGKCSWGYGAVKTDGKSVMEDYTLYAEMLKDFQRRGLAGAVYTQTTDVEYEINGLMTYDRAVIKVDEAALRSVNLSVIESGK